MFTTLSNRGKHNQKTPMKRGRKKTADYQLIVRFTNEQKKFVEELQEQLDLPSKSETIRHCIKFFRALKK